MQTHQHLEELCKITNINFPGDTRKFEIALCSHQENLVAFDAGDRTLMGLQLLLDQMGEEMPTIKKVDKALIDYYIAKIDEKMSEQLDTILHHPEFQDLEARWRGLSIICWIKPIQQPTLK